MKKLFMALVILMPLAAAAQERVGISAVPLHVFDDATMPGKEFRVLRTTYAPGGQNPKHYHASHVVFYVLEGSGIWQEDGKPRSRSRRARRCTCVPVRSTPTATPAPRRSWCSSSS